MESGEELPDFVPVAVGVSTENGGNIIGALPFVEDSSDDSAQLRRTPGPPSDPEKTFYGRKSSEDENMRLVEEAYDEADSPVNGDETTKIEGSDSPTEEFAATFDKDEEKKDESSAKIEETTVTGPPATEVATEATGVADELMEDKEEPVDNGFINQKSPGSSPTAFQVHKEDNNTVTATESAHQEGAMEATGVADETIDDKEEPDENGTIKLQTPGTPPAVAIHDVREEEKDPVTVIETVHREATEGRTINDETDESPVTPRVEKKRKRQRASEADKLMRDEGVQRMLTPKRKHLSEVDKLKKDEMVQNLRSSPTTRPVKRRKRT